MFPNKDHILSPFFTQKDATHSCQINKLKAELKTLKTEYQRLNKPIGHVKGGSQGFCILPILSIEDAKKSRHLSDRIHILQKTVAEQETLESICRMQ